MSVLSELVLWGWSPLGGEVEKTEKPPSVQLGDPSRIRLPGSGLTTLAVSSCFRPEVRLYSKHSTKEVSGFDFLPTKTCHVHFPATPLWKATPSE